jgi:leucyl aminopeptidase
MKSSAILSLCAATLAAAVAHPDAEQLILQDPMLKPTIVEPDEYLIELSPGETRLVTEDEKWALRRVRAIELHEASKPIQSSYYPSTGARH